MFDANLLQFALGAMSLIAIALYVSTWRGKKSSSRAVSAAMALVLASVAYVAAEVYALPAVRAFEAGDVVRGSAARLCGALLSCVVAWLLAIKFAQQSLKVE